MFTITKQFAFSASHQLHGLPEGHPCGRLHGHNYIVEAVLAGMPDPATGFVEDYGDLAWFKTLLDDQLDHRHLNDHPWFQAHNPTAEHLAARLFRVLADRYGHKAAAVRVSETPKTWAEYRPRP